MRPILITEFHLFLALLLVLALPALAMDSDGDGIDDSLDNCSAQANASQIDADQDGYGNICDHDHSQDGIVGGPDFAVFVASFGLSDGDEGFDPRADYSGDGTVGGIDFGLTSPYYGSANGVPRVPGPSGLACAGTIPCP